MGKVIGYIRVSTDRQTTENQRLAVLEYCNRNDWTVDDWISVEASSRRTSTERRIDELLAQVSAGDLVVVSELSRLGRSVGQIVILVNEFFAAGVRVVCIKEGIDLDGRPDIQAKVMVTMFSLFAEIERDLISERTREGLARARAQGKLLGRPKGPGKSKLDKHEARIRELLALEVPKARDRGQVRDHAGEPETLDEKEGDYMMIISFAWTTPVLLAGRKTVTRRVWKDDRAMQFKAGTWCRPMTEIRGLAGGLYGKKPQRQMHPLK